MSAEGYFSSELMPVAYNAWYLAPTLYQPIPTVESCGIFGYGHSFERAPASAQVQWKGSVTPYQEDKWQHLLVLGKKTWTASQYAYPPPKLTEQVFSPVSQGGFGLNLPEFVWESYKDNPYVSCYNLA